MNNRQTKNGMSGRGKASLFIVGIACIISGSVVKRVINPIMFGQQQQIDSSWNQSDDFDDFRSASRKLDESNQHIKDILSARPDALGPEWFGE